VALIQGQQLGSQVQQVENSVWAKYMVGPHSQESVWPTQPTQFRRVWLTRAQHATRPVYISARQ